MTYELAFLEPALKEWRKLAPDLRDQFILAFDDMFGTHTTIRTFAEIISH